MPEKAVESCMLCAKNKSLSSVKYLKHYKIQMVVVTFS